MELFQQLGLAGELLGHGVINSGIDFYVGGARVGGLNYDVAGSPDTPYPFVLLLPQARTEALLIADLARHGVEVEREVRITGLEQDAGGVVAHGTAADGREVAIRTLYAIGGDGAHSAVRTAVGLSFEGATYAQPFCSRIAGSSGRTTMRASACS